MESQPRPSESSTQEKATDFSGRVAGASAWSVSSMGGMLFIRFFANILLARFLVPEQFGVVAVLRIILLLLEQVSDVGIRGSVIYHKRGENTAFLNTAWTLQILRGVLLWIVCCLLAKPAVLLYPDMGALALLLPVAGFEAINNGFQSVGIYTRQRRLDLRIPSLLDWGSLVVNVTVTLVWAWVDASVWALVAGPVAAGFAKTVASHLFIPEVRHRLAWDKEVFSDLFRFGKWVILGTIVTFIAQQFHTLYLAKLVPLAMLGLYERAWTFVNQTTRVLTVISNTVLTPLFAQYKRISSEMYTSKTREALDRFLPVCLFVVVPIGLVCPALFGYMYPKAFELSGTLGRWLAIVVWFMILQQVPRTVLLAVGISRGVALMAAANAAVTITGCVAGYAIGSRFDVGFGATKGLIVGNALGNVVGCIVGGWHTRSKGVRVGLPMLRYSLWFVALTLMGVAFSVWLPLLNPAIDDKLASLISTVAMAVPLGAWSYVVCIRGFLQSRKSAPAQAVAP